MYVVIFGVFLYQLEVDSIKTSEMISNFPEVLMNFNQLFLKLNRFICD